MEIFFKKMEIGSRKIVPYCWQGSNWTCAPGIKLNFTKAFIKFHKQIFRSSL